MDLHSIKKNVSIKFLYNNYFKKSVDRFGIYVYFVAEVFPADKNLFENRISLLDRSDSREENKLKNNEEDMTNFV